MSKKKSTKVGDVEVTTTRNKVLELPNMPERDNVGNEAERYVAMLEDVERLKEQAEKQAAKLRDAMLDANRRFIRVKGRVITIAHIEEQIKLKVKKG